MATLDNEQSLSSRVLVEMDAGRLESWKEIACYLRRTVRTVQRWEKREGLIIHRLFHKNAGTIYAFKDELDSWMHSRCRVTGDSAANQTPTGLAACISPHSISRGHSFADCSQAGPRSLRFVQAWEYSGSNLAFSTSIVAKSTWTLPAAIW
jgi:hypothetical protein